MASSYRSLIPVTKDDAASNIFWIEKGVKAILLQINDLKYELWQGRCNLGVIIFHKGPLSGWRFYPRQPRKRPSRKLHPSAEAAVMRYCPVEAIYTSGALGRIGEKH